MALDVVRYQQRAFVERLGASSSPGAMNVWRYCKGMDSSLCATPCESHERSKTDERTNMLTILKAYVSDFSSNFNAAILLWPLLSLFLSLPVLFYLYRRDGWLRLSTIFVVYGSILYAAGLACFTLYPLPDGDAGPGITYGIPPILDPLNFIRDVSCHGLPALFQLLFNIALFVPLGFIAKLLLKLRLGPTLALSFATTCLIETAQITGLFGIYPYAFRTFDVDDLICNTLGGLLGWGLGQLFVRLVMKESATVPPITHDPGFARRFVTLWTDFMIVNVCFVIPRVLIAVGLGLLMESPSSIGGLPIDQLDQIASMTCFVVAFVIVEVVVPWRHGGSTPAGMFYRMSFETKKRTGTKRAAFYILRAALVFLLFLFPRYLALPLLLFYLVARRMPYDLVPGKAGATQGCSSEEALSN